MAALIPSANRTAIPYRFREKDAQAIIKTVTFHRAEYSGNPIEFKSKTHAKIRSSISTPFSRRPVTDLGAFHELPLELLWDIFLRLDIQSVFRFRQVNRIARQSVDSLKEYNLVATHGLDAYCALLQTHSTLHASLHDFVSVLSISSCSQCGCYGGFISLLTWQRCCFCCIRHAPELQVRTLASLRSQINLDKVQLRELQTLKTLPGEYTREQKHGELTYSKRRLNVTSLHQAVMSIESPSRAHKLLSAKRTHRAGEKGLYRFSSDTFDMAWSISKRVYDHEGFLEHFQWCGEAQRLWKSSKRGKVRPKGMPKEIQIMCCCKACD